MGPQVLQAPQACHGSSCFLLDQNSSMEAGLEEVGYYLVLQVEVLLQGDWHDLLQRKGLVLHPAQPLKTSILYPYELCPGLTGEVPLRLLCEQQTCWSICSQMRYVLLHHIWYTR